MARTEYDQRVETVPVAGAVPATAVTAAGPPQAKDSTRWGPIWAGLVALIALFLVLETLFIALGAVTYTRSGGSITVHTNQLWITGILALISFFVGGWLAGASSAVRGMGAGMINGLLVWALATTLFVLGSFLGAGAALGAVGNLINALPVGVIGHATRSVTVPGGSALTTAAWWGFATLVITGVVSAVGGWIGGIGTTPFGFIGRQDVVDPT